MPRFRVRHSAKVVSGVTLVLLAYIFGLNSIHIPSIGDETPYLQIARVTGESGRWLPLRAEEGIKNTKPPLLFWQGMASTAMSKHWNLWALRLPVVLTTLLVALLVGIMTQRISGDKHKALLGALIYLGFMSTLQQGRPFLMHAAETLLLFLPLLLILQAPRLTVGRALICGLCLGLAALYKSFFLIAVGGFALALAVLPDRKQRPDSFFKEALVFFLLAVLSAGALFALWPLLDPSPELIFEQFFFQENLGKFSPAAFFRGLFTGPYSLLRIWLGNLANAGLYALLLLVLVIDLARRRRNLAPEEKKIWLYILGFLILYSLPTQRQENYILPTCAALSVLLAWRWDRLKSWAFRVSCVLVGGVTAAALWFCIGAARHLDGAPISPLLWVSVVILLTASLAASFRDRWARVSIPFLILGMMFCVNLFLQPFSRPFSPEAQKELAGRTVHFPIRFYAGQELYRFILPGSRLVGYSGPVRSLDPSVRFLAMEVPMERAVPEEYRVIDQIMHLRSRHSPEQIRAILFKGRFDLLVDRLVLVERLEINESYAPTLEYRGDAATGGIVQGSHGVAAPIAPEAR
jgi:4-amino-4-deoxy-L-arabinose transferase-like glycosyltransferase